MLDVFFKCFPGSESCGGFSTKPIHNKPVQNKPANLFYLNTTFFICEMMELLVKSLNLFSFFKQWKLRTVNWFMAWSCRRKKGFSCWSFSRTLEMMILRRWSLLQRSYTSKSQSWLRLLPSEKPESKRKMVGIKESVNKEMDEEQQKEIKKLELKVSLNSGKKVSGKILKDIVCNRKFKDC